MQFKVCWEKEASRSLTYSSNKIPLEGLYPSHSYLTKVGFTLTFPAVHLSIFHSSQLDILVPCYQKSLIFHNFSFSDHF